MSKALQADKALVSKKYKLAVSLYRDALTEEPENPNIYQGLAQSLFRTNAYEEAMSTARKALELNSELAVPHVVIANVHYTRKEVEDYKSEALRAYELDPSSAEVLICYGTMLLEEKNLDGGIEILNRALQRTPNDLQALNNLAVAYLVKGDNKEFYRLTKKLFFVAPSVKTGFRLAEVYFATHTRIVGITLLALVAVALVLRNSFILLFPFIYFVYSLWITFRAFLLKQWKHGLALAVFDVLFLAILFLVFILIRISTPQAPGL